MISRIPCPNFGLLAGLVSTLLCACAGAEPEPATSEPQGHSLAHAQQFDQSGELVADATVSPVEEGVTIEVEVYDLPPGVHGFHIHETGRCDAPDFESAGGHLNPLDAGHGLGDEDGAHLGDLPNLPVGVDGEAESTMLVAGVSLAEDDLASLLAGDGTALVVHAEADDYETNPAGDAGARIACGVLEPRSEFVQ